MLNPQVAPDFSHSGGGGLEDANWLNLFLTLTEKRLGA
jgi:hypothetical protein